MSSMNWPALFYMTNNIYWIFNRAFWKYLLKMGCLKKLKYNFFLNEIIGFIWSNVSSSIKINLYPKYTQFYIYIERTISLVKSGQCILQFRLFFTYSWASNFSSCFWSQTLNTIYHFKTGGFLCLVLSNFLKRLRWIKNVMQTHLIIKNVCNFKVIIDTDPTL